MAAKRLPWGQGNILDRKPVSGGWERVVLAVRNLDVGKRLWSPRFIGIVPRHVTILTGTETLAWFAEIAISPFEMGGLLIGRLDGLPIYSKTVTSPVIVEHREQNVMAGAAHVGASHLFAKLRSDPERLLHRRDDNGLVVVRPEHGIPSARNKVAGKTDLLT